MKQILIPAFAMAMTIVSCNNSTNRTLSGIDPSAFDTIVNGKQTALYTLTNANGLEAGITNYGGRIVSLMVPDRNGDMRDIVLGFDNINDYLPENNQTDFGAAIGRYANRINQGRFVIDGDTAVLPQNNYGHCLHGGTDMGTLGWQYRVYDAQQPNDSTLILSLEDADGNNGFPGTVNAQITYTLTADNSLKIDYTATTDKPTVINLTNHSYFNLGGDPTASILDNILTLNASGYTPVDSTFMTTGEIATVENTPFDFRGGRAIGDSITSQSEQIRNGKGYDHNFVFDTTTEGVVANLYSPASGISMDVLTVEPGIQVYSGNFLDGTVKGKKGIVYQRNAAVCLETQHYPDSPNKPQWPSVRLNPGEKYETSTTFHFTTK
ncbi:aldose epimerase family protein [uncultured Muribaculum sp.]|uniref:aldose epimerase family protein n=1 Tax=uncultured Muribaculum sp. TaxID=1918613 RepID=UPI0025D9A4A8|nr:aldose epimerase family protein [uncultured Muribaculum sp.]